MWWNLKRLEIVMETTGPIYQVCFPCLQSAMEASYFTVHSPQRLSTTNVYTLHSRNGTCLRSLKSEEDKELPGPCGFGSASERESMDLGDAGSCPALSAPKIFSLSVVCLPMYHCGLRAASLCLTLLFLPTLVGHWLHRLAESPNIGRSSEPTRPLGN